MSSTGIIHYKPEDVVRQFEAHGLRCAVVVNPFGGCNGYVQLPEAHPVEWTGYEAIPVEAHGGLTYGPDEDRWIGFDTLHLGDWWAGDIVDKAKTEDGRRVYADVLHRGEDESGSIGWTTDLVAKECERIAMQLSRAISSPTPDEHH